MNKEDTTKLIFQILEPFTTYLYEEIYLNPNMDCYIYENIDINEDTDFNASLVLKYFIQTEYNILNKIRYDLFKKSVYYSQLIKINKEHFFQYNNKIDEDEIDYDILEDTDLFVFNIIKYLIRHLFLHDYTDYRPKYIEFINNIIYNLTTTTYLK